ncbi:MAG: hypothetical protein GC161_16275 [Planctomycetaceae bacterium]|nr:hypothetical protein [Planctomycetaceae bacterium]
MNDELDLIAEALRVRDEGQEARSSAVDFDRALMFVARREQKPAEEFHEALARVVRTSDDADALIFAATRRRAAEASLGKAHKEQPMKDNVLPRERLEPLVKALTDADRVAKGLSRPSFPHTTYEDAMTDLARYEADGVGSTAKAYARLLEEGDDRMVALYKAAEAAREQVPEYPNQDRRELAAKAIEDTARLRQRPGESLAGSVARLLEEDPTARDCYAYYTGL